MDGIEASCACFRVPVACPSEGAVAGNHGDSEGARQARRPAVTQIRAARPKIS